MNDSQFDDFVNDRLKEYAAPVPAGLWEKVAEGQFDQFVGSKLRDASASVPEGLWDKISDKLFDNFVADKVEDTAVPVPAGLWDKIADGQFDGFVAGKLNGTEAAVPAGLWDKITDGQFDHFVAGKLTNYEAPVPEGLWEKVRPKEEDDDRVGFFWMRYPAAAALILAILTAAAWGGYVYFSRKNQPVEVTRTATTPSGSSANDANKRSAQPNNGGITAPSQPGNKAGENTVVNNDKTNTANPSSTGSDNNRTKPGSVTPNNVTSNNAISGKPLPGNAPSNNTIKSSDATVLNHKKPQAGSILTPPPVNNDISANRLDIFNNGIGKKMGETDKTNEASQAAVEDLPVTAFQASFSPLTTIPFGLNYQPSADKQLSTLNHTNQFKSVIICPGDKMNREWQLEVYASPDLAFKSVTNVSAPASYMLRKDSSESMQIGYTAGLRLVKPITDNILLKAGIQYSQANEKYVYRTENEIKTTTVVSVRTIIRGPGDTVVVHDTSTLQTAGFKNNTVKNHFRSIDIPLMVGYQFGDEDLKFGITAGAILNLSSWYQGVILDTSLATVTLNKNGNSVYKTKTGLGLYAGISIVKKLGDDMQAFVEPYFRYNLSDMTTPNAGFKQRLNFGGVSVGLRFNLNKKY